MERKEYYYTYYSYEEWGRGYIGSRKCYCLPEEDIKYFGSFYDKTFCPTQKIILGLYDSREDAIDAEIVLHRFYDVANNPHFANQSRQTSRKFYLPTDRAKEIGKRSGNKVKELGIGIHALTKEQKIQIGKETGHIGGKVAGHKFFEEGLGIFGMSEEDKRAKNIKGGKIGGKKCKDEGIGIFSLTLEQKIEIGKKSAKKLNAQRWMCLETGYITNPGALTSYQRKRGIDTSKRVKLS